MITKSVRRAIGMIGIVCLWAMAAPAMAQESRTVIGPSNPDLHEGANALMAGDAEEGVRLTLRGLQHESSRRHRNAGLSNLCAGYIMLNEFEKALSYCDEVIADNDEHWRAYSNRALANLKLNRLEEAEQDLQRAEEIAPQARTVRIVRAMLLDETDPVAPHIVIDERRQPAETDED